MYRKGYTRRRVMMGIGSAFAGAMALPLISASTTSRAADNEDVLSTEEARQFIAAYSKAFQTFDGSKIASFYHAPCVTVRGDGSIHSFKTRAEVEQFFQGVADTYKREGEANARFYDLVVVPIGARSALITLTWEQLRKDNSVLRSWRHSYNVVRTGDGWQILTSTFHLSQ